MNKHTYIYYKCTHARERNDFHRIFHPPSHPSALLTESVTAIYRIEKQINTLQEMWRKLLLDYLVMAFHFTLLDD